MTKLLGSVDQTRASLESRQTRKDYYSFTFAALLIEKNRLMHFADISSIFEEVMSAERGELKGTITTSRVREACNKFALILLDLLLR